MSSQYALRSVEDDPGLARSVYDAFTEARILAIDRLKQVWLGSANRLTLPWRRRVRRADPRRNGRRFLELRLRREPRGRSTRCAATRVVAAPRRPPRCPRGPLSSFGARHMMFHELLPPDMTLAETFALLGASFGTIRSSPPLSAIGGGALLIAILASVLPPAVLIPIHGIVQVGSNLGRAAIMLRHLEWSIIPAFVADR